MRALLESLGLWQDDYTPFLTAPDTGRELLVWAELLAKRELKESRLEVWGDAILQPLIWYWLMVLGGQLWKGANRSGMQDWVHQRPHQEWVLYQEEWKGLITPEAASRRLSYLFGDYIGVEVVKEVRNQKSIHIHHPFETGKYSDLYTKDTLATVCNRFRQKYYPLAVALRIPIFARSAYFRTKMIGATGTSRFTPDATPKPQPAVQQFFFFLWHGHPIRLEWTDAAGVKTSQFDQRFQNLLRTAKVDGLGGLQATRCLWPSYITPDNELIQVQPAEQGLRIIYQKREFVWDDPIGERFSLIQSDWPLAVQQWAELYRQVRKVPLALTQYSLQLDALYADNERTDEEERILMDDYRDQLNAYHTRAARLAYQISSLRDGHLAAINKQDTPRWVHQRVPVTAPATTSLTPWLQEHAALRQALEQPNRDASALAAWIQCHAAQEEEAFMHLAPHPMLQHFQEEHKEVCQKLQWIAAGSAEFDDPLIALLLHHFAEEEEFFAAHPPAVWTFKPTVQQADRFARMRVVPHEPIDPAQWEGFRELQDEQRGLPERMFEPNFNPGAGNSGLLQWAMEHTGDLIHRAAYGNWGGGWSYGWSAVKEKAEKLLRIANNMDRFRPDDPLEQAKRNWQYAIDKGYTTQTQTEYVQEVKAAARRYADSYAKLKPLTVLQKKGRDAAIMLGEGVQMGDFTTYRYILQAILDMPDTPAMYFKRLGEETRVSDSRHDSDLLLGLFLLPP